MNRLIRNALNWSFLLFIRTISYRSKSATYRPFTEKRRPQQEQQGTFEHNKSQEYNF